MDTELFIAALQVIESSMPDSNVNATHALMQAEKRQNVIEALQTRITQPRQPDGIWHSNVMRDSKSGFPIAWLFLDEPADGTKIYFDRNSTKSF